eukprot:scaffold197959_cov31-Tisochrysis_lutea.AAC.3
METVVKSYNVFADSTQVTKRINLFEQAPSGGAVRVSLICPMFYEAGHLYPKDAKETMMVIPGGGAAARKLGRRRAVRGGGGQRQGLARGNSNSNRNREQVEVSGETPRRRRR